MNEKKFFVICGVFFFILSLSFINYSVKNLKLFERKDDEASQLIESFDSHWNYIAQMGSSELKAVQLRPFHISYWETKVLWNTYKYSGEGIFNLMELKNLKFETELSFYIGILCFIFCGMFSIGFVIPNCSELEEKANDTN